MIVTIDDLWKDSTEINNNQYEIFTTGTENVLVIKDFLKYPDKLKNLIHSFPYFDSQPTWRPGKTAGFPSSHCPKFGSFISKQFADIFQSNDVQCYDLYVNCFNGKMNCSYQLPHVDCSIFPLSVQTHIAVNICLTENMLGGTSFWSFKNKMNLFDMSLGQINELYHIMNSFNSNNSMPWKQFTGDINFEMEKVVPMEYNTLVAYPTTTLHSPYIETNWFETYDRISLAAFLQIYPNFTPSADEKLWKKFRLKDVFNLTF